MAWQRFVYDWRRDTVRRNRCLNPALGANATDWSGYADSGTIVGRTAATGFDRPEVYRVDANNLYAEIHSAQADAASGEAWTASVHARCSLTATVTLFLRYRRPDGTYAPGTSSSHSVTANEARRISVTGTTPAGINRVRALLYYSHATLAYTLEMTAALLERTGTAKPYLDGESPGCVWLGTRYNSISEDRHGPSRLLAYMD